LLKTTRDGQGGILNDAIVDFVVVIGGGGGGGGGDEEDLSTCCRDD